MRGTIVIATRESEAIQGAIAALNRPGSLRTRFRGVTQVLGTK